MNYRCVAALSLAAALAFVQPVMFAAQEANKALAILADARKAIGGTTLDDLKTFSLESANQRNAGSIQITSDVELAIEVPDKFVRIENVSAPMAMTTRTGFNGGATLSSGGGPTAAGSGMMVFSMGPGGMQPGPPAKLSPEEEAAANATRLRTAQTDISRLMLGWFAMAHPALRAQYAYSGEAESPDGKAYVVDVTNADGFSARLFIDEQSHLPLMVTYKAARPRTVSISAPPPGQGKTTTGGDKKQVTQELTRRTTELQKEPPVIVDYTIFFDDWRTADGIKFPFKIRRATGATTTEEWTVSRIEVNPRIDPKKFAPAS